MTDDRLEASGWTEGVVEEPAEEEPKPKPKMVQEDDENFYGGQHEPWPWQAA